MSQTPEGDPPQPAGRQQLRFFGAITARISHEINNVLAMINELSGLLEDNIVMAKDRDQVDLGRLESIAQRIGAQVQSGKTIVTSLNAFAHRLDQLDASMDLGQNIEQVFELCQSFARLRRSELIVQHAAAAIRMRGCAFTLQHLIYRGIEVGLTTAGPDHPVTVEYEEQDGQALIRILGGPCGDAQPESTALKASLARLAEQVGGRLLVSEAVGQALLLTLHLPLDLRESPATKL